MTRLVLLDCEAVQALGNQAHRKHQRLLAHVQVVAQRKKRAIPVALAAPSAVRVEAGWDRASPAWAFANRLRIADIPLETSHGNVAAAIRNRTGVSVADAHLAAAIRLAAADHITAITSDPGDIRTVAEGRRIEIVAI